jgi:flagellar hook assembly protein FlgD
MVGRAYPSPTTGPVSMAYNLVHAAKTEVSIFDLSGSLVKRLETPGAVGANHAVWNGTDEQGRGVAAGVYYYSVKAEDAPVASGKVTLTR